MSLLPEPLHPAVVHFPIVLLLLGAIAALAAIVWRKHHAPVLAAMLLSLGALGCWLALETGESNEDAFKSGAPAVNAVLEEHEHWAKRTFGIALVSSVLATASMALFRWPRFARVVAVATACAALAGVYAVYQTGHHGGALVYGNHHGTRLVQSSTAILPRAMHHDGD